MSALQDFSDAQLVVAIGRYDESALAEVYRRHSGAVFSLARRVAGVVGDAEEITQEVFVRLWNNPDRFDPARGSLRTFLMTQSHGRAVDLVRSRTARSRREEREARVMATADYDLERQVWDLALADQVSQALTTLPDDERKAIELAYFGAHSYREVADLLGTPEGTIKSRIRTGLRRLRVALSEAGVNSEL